MTANVTLGSVGGGEDLLDPNPVVDILEVSQGATIFQEGIDCPPNSTEMTIRNFGHTRITMGQIHDIIKDVEDLKYNDAQYQMNNELQNRDAQSKKGIYSDDFSNTAQSAVGIQFTERDASIPVTVQIRGVTTGLPNDTIFAEKVIAPSEINLGGETKISFDDPFYAEANTSYAVVLLTNSTNYKVRTATLGKTGRQGIITRQTYAEGVLLETSNAETWTPLNGSDLTMKLYGYEFENEGTVQFQPVSGVQFSDLNIDEYSAIPEGTHLSGNIPQMVA